MKYRITAALIAALTFSFGASAHAGNPQPAQAATVISAPVVYPNPYQNALSCIAANLTPEQRQTTIGVGYFVDRTGRDTYSQDNGAGKFLSQGVEDQLINDLAATGMSAVDMNNVTRSLIDWQAQKLISAGAKLPLGEVPDILVNGSIDSADFGVSDAKELYVFGIGGGLRAYTFRYTLDARAVRMPGSTNAAGNPYPAGAVLTTVAFQKDVVGYESKAGIAAFFGPLNSATYVQFDVDHDKRELIQYSERYMVSRTVIGIVTNLWHITACDAAIQQGDDLITGHFPGNVAKR